MTNVFFVQDDLSRVFATEEPVAEDTLHTPCIWKGQMDTRCLADLHLRI